MRSMSILFRTNIVFEISSQPTDNNLLPAQYPIQGRNT